MLCVHFLATLANECPVPGPGFLSTVVLQSLSSLIACTPVKMTKTVNISTKMSLEEERAAEFFLTAMAEKTLAASWVSPYAEVSNEEKSCLVFWFPWNDEYVLLLINESS